MKIKEITNKEIFREKINTQAVVMFWASWCLPCIKFKPIFEQTVENNYDKNFYYVNVEKAEAIIEAENIASVPAIHIYKEGKLVAKLKEYTQAGLENFLKKF